MRNRFLDEIAGILNPRSSTIFCKPMTYKLRLQIPPISQPARPNIFRGQLILRKADLNGSKHSKQFCLIYTAFKIVLIRTASEVLCFICLNGLLGGVFYTMWSYTIGIGQL